MSLLDATPAAQFDDDNEQVNKLDRKKSILTPGLPPAPQTLIVPTITTDDATTHIDDLQVITTSGGNTVLTHELDTLVDRVYWSEYPDF